ncbi:hypothetical protein G7046_g1941 [Stylonectria norvegica]|nr:hypothetical protein G7046_g1941 [Stylonectria norvegica]
MAKSRTKPLVSEEDAAAIFRRHFEANFAPLPASFVKAVPAPAVDVGDENETVEEEDADAEDEWGGLSEDGDEDGEQSEDGDVPVAIEIIDHSVAQPPKPTTMSKRELKAFMSSRPPDQTAPISTVAQQATTNAALPEDAPTLLAQDLELRRLLAESHLLRPAMTSTGADVAPKAFAAGRTRHKATDLRVQALGSKTSIHKQDKMPMNIRKGIVTAAGARETKRRREAKENGVILERETVKKKAKKDNTDRDMGVHRPGVGRLKGAMLTVSDRDVRKIEGGRDVFGRKGKR